MRYHFLWIGAIQAVVAILLCYAEGHAAYGGAIATLILFIAYVAHHFDNRDDDNADQVIQGNYEWIPPGEYNAIIEGTDGLGRVTRVRIADGKFKGRQIGR